jgi:hypothetical protein
MEAERSRGCQGLIIFYNLCLDHVGRATDPRYPMFWGGVLAAWRLPWPRGTVVNLNDRTRKLITIRHDNYYKQTVAAGALVVNLELIWFRESIKINLQLETWSKLSTWSNH